MRILNVKFGCTNQSDEGLRSTVRDGLPAPHPLAFPGVEPPAGIPWPEAADVRAGEKQLRMFLHQFQTRLLIPIELPAIIEAWTASRHQDLDAMLRLDARLAKTIEDLRFAEASRQLGRAQLRQFRPLQDHRMVQRYRHAVQQGNAAGWHLITYGLFLDVYSIPPREGLLHYAEKTLASLAAGANKQESRHFPAAQIHPAELLENVKPAIDRLVPGFSPHNLRVI